MTAPATGRSSGASSDGPSVVELTAVQWEDVTRCFAEACALPESARVAYVADAVGDAVLRAEVMALLAEHREDSFLGTTLIDEARDGAIWDDSAFDTGATIGSCTLLRRLGRGGMGTVFEAEQHVPARRVAIKLLPPDDATSGAGQRFRHEADMMARLRHPHIAQIFAAGQAPGGATPPCLYVVMELVLDAAPLTEYVRTHGGSMRRGLPLFIDLCDAVAHAHRQGVIHCDLKPSNTLVDRGGTVKVIDFGIARRAGAVMREAREAGGTPGYIAPEVIERGDAAISTQADVFAIGCLLRECRAVSCDARGSGELSAVIARATQRDPSLRYRSADALRSDLIRVLEHRPVSARRTRLGRSAAMAIRRRPIAALLATAALTVVVGGAHVLRATHVARKASERTTHEVSEFVRTVFGSPTVTANGPTLRVTDVLTSAADELASRAPEPSGHHAAWIVSMHRLLGDSMTAVGQFAEAEMQYHAELAILEQHGVAPTDSRVFRIRYDLAGLAYDQGRFDDAVRQYETVLAWRESTYGVPGREVAEVLNDLAIIDLERGAHATAIDRFDQVSEMLAACGLERSVPSLNATFNRSIAQRSLGQYAEAAVGFSRLASAYDELGGRYGQESMNARRFLAEAKLRLGQVEDAAALIGTVMDALRSTVGDRHIDYAGAVVVAARIARERGLRAEARRHYDTAISIYAEQLAPDHPYATQMRAERDRLDVTTDHAEQDPLSR